jgi:putative restriction endonuclease
MRGFVAPTDRGWYQFLRLRRELTEVNFWRPGATTFAALRPGEVFFFKLKAPADAIGGFGLFTRFDRLPVWQAWDVFGEANGSADQYDLLRRLSRLSARPIGPGEFDRVIGCIAVTHPVFFAPDEWVRVPADWSRNIVSGRSYDLTEGEGLRLWIDCLERAAHTHPAVEWTTQAIELRRHGKPQLILPRLGQASFRLAVLEAYGGRCAVTTEHSLPVLEAAHIKPWRQGGGHEIQNGLPLRRDIHALFDLGFVTVRPDLTFAVSPGLHDAYANGRTYYALQGRRITVPDNPTVQPARDALEWHGDVVFRA